MKLNQKGFNDVIMVTIIGGIIGSLFITGVFVWKEIDKQNTLNNLYNQLSRVVKVNNEKDKEVATKDKQEINIDDWIKYNDSINKISFEYPPTYEIRNKEESGIIMVGLIGSFDRETEIFPLASIYTVEEYNPEIKGEKFNSLEGIKKAFNSLKERCNSPEICDVTYIEDIQVDNRPGLKVGREGVMEDIIIIISTPSDNFIVIYSYSDLPDIFNSFIKTFKFLDGEERPVYNLKNFNISLSVPRDYVSSDDFNKTDIKFYGFCKQGCITIKQIDENLEDYISNVTEGPFSELISREVVTVDGIEATKFVASSDIGIDYNYVYFIKGDNKYVISSQDFINEFDDVIDSVKFLK
ncbi:hypothetical protein KKH39_01785 [Patescibacteria group bacterium]|nr:hypothetical protein [Patescibacteria group bacterium]